MFTNNQFSILIAFLQILFVSCSTHHSECITAAWHEGDMHEFRMEETSYDVHENGDTTVTSQGIYDISVSVIKESNVGYQMRLDYPTSMYTDIIEIDLSDIGEFIPIEFKTNKFGTFKAVTNTGFLVKLSERII